MSLTLELYADGASQTQAAYGDLGLTLEIQDVTAAQYVPACGQQANAFSLGEIYV